MVHTVPTLRCVALFMNRTEQKSKYNYIPIAIANAFATACLRDPFPLPLPSLPCQPFPFPWFGGRTAQADTVSQAEVMWYLAKYFLGAYPTPDTRREARVPTHTHTRATRRRAGWNVRCMLYTRGDTTGAGGALRERCRGGVGLGWCGTGGVRRGGVWSLT